MSIKLTLNIDADFFNELIVNNGIGYDSTKSSNGARGAELGKMMSDCFESCSSQIIGIGISNFVDVVAREVFKGGYKRYWFYINERIKILELLDEDMEKNDGN